MIRILVTDPIDSKGLALFKENDHFEVVETKDPKDFGRFEAWLVRSETKVTKEKIAQAKSLKLIGRAGTGVDNIDVDEATRRGILVINVPGANAIAVSEHVFALLLGLVRRIPLADQRVKSGLWRDKVLIGRELYGKTLGIVGLGRVGREVAFRARAFQMKVLGYDPFVSPQVMGNAGVEPVSWNELLELSDIISLHVPLTEMTRYLLNNETLDKTKPGVILLNTSRGDVIDEKALVQALKTGHLAACGLDVFEREPLPAESKLRSFGDRVLFTPHLGATTEEAQCRVATELTQNVIDFFERGIVKGGVNLPAAFDTESLERLKNYLTLAERLGRFLGRVSPGVWESFELRTSKSFSEKEQKILERAGLRGLLSCVLGEKVNMVNADFYARERKLKLETDFFENEDSPLEELLLTVKTSKGELMAVSGRVDSSGSLVISKIGELSVSVNPQGNLIVIENEDQPGMIGQVGMLLGKRKINIADMRVGRKAKGATAVMVLTIDEAVSKIVLSDLEKLKGVKRVTSVCL